MLNAYDPNTPLWRYFLCPTNELSRHSVMYVRSLCRLSPSNEMRLHFLQAPLILGTPLSMSGLIYVIERTSEWALCSSVTCCWNQRREIIARVSLPWLNELGGHQGERDNPRYMHRGAWWHPKIPTLRETRVMAVYSAWNPLTHRGHPLSPKIHFRDSSSGRDVVRLTNQR